MAFDWRKLVRTIAPTLGTALGGPLGGMAMGALSQALLGKKDGTEEEIRDAIINATPADFLKLKELEQTFSKDMKALDIDVFRLEIQDKASARDMFKVNYWPQVILSGLYVGGYFVILGLLLAGKFSQVDPSWRESAALLLGVLTTNVPIIMAFWFGSSFGSKEKSQMLALSAPVSGTGAGG